MAASELELVNRALARIGHTVQLTAVDDSTIEGQQATLLLAPLRKELLSRYPWRFATKRVALTVDASVDRDDWAYGYAVPATVLVEREIEIEGNRNPSEADRIPFEIEMNEAETGKVLLTDAEDAVLVHTVDVSTVTLWPAAFDEAFIWRLAGEFALSVKKDGALARAMLTQAEVALEDAFNREMNRRQRDLEPNTPSIASRA